MSNYEQEKSHERKRKAAYLEAIFENTATKKQTSQGHHNNSEGLAGREAGSKHSGAPSNPQEPAMANNTAAETTSIAVSAHRVSSHGHLRPPQVTLSTPNHSNPEPPKTREKGASTSEGGNQFVGFQRTSSEANEKRGELQTKERAGEIKVAAGLNNGVKVKQEQTSEGETLPVQLVSVQGRHEEKVKTEGGEGDGDDDYFKYLLFAGKLYHCERVSDLTHNYLRFGTESLHGRKGDDFLTQKVCYDTLPLSLSPSPSPLLPHPHPLLPLPLLPLPSPSPFSTSLISPPSVAHSYFLYTFLGKVVVLLLFHKIYREVVNYVVGVIEHSTVEEQTIAVGIIKSHTYSSSRISHKDFESKIVKFPIGSKKLLCNLQCLDGPVYSELVKILDGFGANSAVDHSKISEFNAMINANADRLDSQLPNYVSDVSHSLNLRTSSSRTFVSPAYGYMSPCIPQSNSTYSPLANRPPLDSPYSALKPHMGAFSGAPERFKTAGQRTEVEIGFSKPLYTTSQHHDRTSKADRPVYTIAANETVEHTRGAPSSVRFHAAGEEKIIRDGAMAVQRRNVEGI